MDIEVGEYVRTKNGKIDIVINDDYYMSLYIECKNGLVEIFNIIKHSKNIIDIIEVGDYVNGHRVVDIMEDIKTGEIHLEMTSDYTNKELEDCTIYNKNIKSIVAKEKFERAEYRAEAD